MNVGKVVPKYPKLKNWDQVLRTYVYDPRYRGSAARNNALDDEGFLDPRTQKAPYQVKLGDRFRVLLTPLGGILLGVYIAKTGVSLIQNDYILEPENPPLVVEDEYQELAEKYSSQ